jgi:K(+)-stimulated pyrophosphate-energized sodium pump
MLSIIRILRMDSVPKEMSEISSYIKESADVYLLRQMRAILLLTPMISVILYFLIGWEAAFTTALGVLTSLLSSYIGMSVSVRVNLRTASAARHSSKSAFRVAVLGGSVTGLCITGFSLTVLTMLFLLLNSFESMTGFGFGASLAALFAQVGGGIFTKSADIGADLVGKVEQNIPEDDPRNAAVIADLVGDNVGDCAGRGSDLFQTFSDDIVTGSIVASLLIPKYGIVALFFPLVLQAAGVLSSMAGISVARASRAKPLSAFNRGLIVSALLAAAGALFVSYIMLNNLVIGISAIFGIGVTLVAAVTTRYYAGMEGKPVSEIAKASTGGAALNIITGLAYGLRSPITSILVIAAAILVAFRISGGMLLSIVAVNIGTDLLIGYIMTADAFGPIVDNAAGISEMSKGEESVTKTLSSLDSVGNTMKAVTKAYAMSSGTITAFVVFITFFSTAGISAIEVSTPFEIGFLFVGITLPFLIASLTIGSTAKAAKLMVDEVRRQFHRIEGLLAGKAKPDYARCVDIATRNALREMVLPGMISLVVPVVVAVVFGMPALGALLIGSVACAAMLGPFFNNTGTAFDNSKKLIEEDDSRRGSLEHTAAVVGDTVGDSLKDVAGPSLLIFMKLIGMTALLTLAVL